MTAATSNRYEVTITATVLANSSDAARKQVEEALWQIRRDSLAIYVESVKKTTPL